MTEFKKIRFRIISFSSVLVLILFLVFKGSSNKPLQGFFNQTISPIARFFSKSGGWVSNKIVFLTSIGELKNQNESLSEENLLLKSKIAKLKDIENENIVLRKEINLAPRDQYILKAARIIGKDLSSQEEVFLIDKGKEDGIVVDMAVIVGEGVLVGKVTQSMSKNAWFKTIKSNDFKINAEVVSSNLSGIALGQFGTSIALDLVQQGVEIKKGDEVITSGAGGNFPRGLLIGYVNDIFSNKEDLFQKASLSSPVNELNLRIIWLVTNQ